MTLIVSGVPGAGKTTISRNLAATWPRGVHLEGDAFGEHVVGGLVLPGAEPSEESERQLLVRRRHLALLADDWSREGAEVVIDDVVLWSEGLELYLDLLTVDPVRLVLLAPTLDVLTARDAGRDKQWLWRWRHFDAELRAWPDPPGLWLDTSTQTAEETVRSVIERWDETLVRGTAPGPARRPRCR